MKKLKLYFLTTIFASFASFTFASTMVFDQSVSKDSLRTLKRMEYKEGIPNGLLHSISLVETNIGQTGKYMPWPYTIRLNGYKGKIVHNIDSAFDELEFLIDLGYQNFDIYIGKDERFYSLSAVSAEEILLANSSAKSIKITSRSLIKYFEKKPQAEKFLKSLIANKWYDFKVGIMQISYKDLSDFEDVTQALNAYDNIQIMVDKLKQIRTKYTWWEAVGYYHSKNEAKSKRYVKNVWSMYQRVHKIKVR